MFNNDWTSIDNTAAADVWQITHRQAFEDKSAERWMDFVSAGKNQALNEILNEPSI